MEVIRISPRSARVIEGMTPIPHPRSEAEFQAMLRRSQVKPRKALASGREPRSRITVMIKDRTLARLRRRAAREGTSLSTIIARLAERDHAHSV